MRPFTSNFWGGLVVVLAFPAVLIAGEAQNAFNEGGKLYKAGKYKEAVAAYNRAIKSSPKADEALTTALGHFKLGGYLQTPRIMPRGSELNANRPPLF